MRAARFSPGGDLTIESVPRPELGPGDLLVEVAGCGICHSDLHVMDGDFPLVDERTLGHEVAGTVVETGEGVTVETGTEVAVYGGWGCRTCRVCTRGEDQLCNLATWLGIGHDGGYAEFLRVPTEKYVLPLDGLDPVEAAPLTDAALTAYRTVETAKPLTPAETVVVVGVGGLGEFGVQFARLTGARVVAVDVRAAACERAAELGAHETVNASEQRVPRAVSAASDGRGASAVLDFVGTDETLEWGSNCLATGGELVLAGIGGGTTEFSWNPLVGSEVSYSTVQWGSVDQLRDILAVARDGRLDVRIETVGFDDLVDTFDRLEAGEIEGRAVLVP